MQEREKDRRERSFLHFPDSDLGEKGPNLALILQARVVFNKGVCVCGHVFWWVCTMVILSDAVQSHSHTKGPVFTSNPRAPALPGI